MKVRNQNYAIGLDLGTSAAKGVVTDAAGRVCASAHVDARYTHPRAGWMESDAEQWLGDIFSMLRALKRESPGRICALAAAAASGNAMLTDGSGEPLMPVISWADQRAVDECPDALRGLTVAELRQVTGWPCLTTFPLAQLAWLAQHRRTVFVAAKRACMNTDWLMWRLTGQWVTDHSTATTSHLQDQCSGTYHEPYLRRLGVTEAMLSRLERTGVVVGPLSTAAASATGLETDVHVVTGCFDHPAAARAVGVTVPGQLLLSCGTSWVGLFPESDRQRVVDAELLCDPFLSERGGPWGAMFSVPRIGCTIDAYVRDVIAPGQPEPFAIFNAAAAAAQPGAGGLRINLLEPVRAIDDSRRNLSRAVMEGAANLLAEKLEVLRQRGFRFREAVMVGGPAQSPVWPSIVAERTSLNVRTGSHTAGAEGAAMLAHQGVGP